MRMVVIGLAAILGYSGCASGPTGKLVGVGPPRPTPTPVVSSPADTVLFMGVDFGVGSNLGGHYDGLFQTFQFEIH